jgi:hypothetical protein
MGKAKATPGQLFAPLRSIMAGTPQPILTTSKAA